MDDIKIEDMGERVKHLSEVTAGPGAIMVFLRAVAASDMSGDLHVYVGYAEHKGENLITATVGAEDGQSFAFTFDEAENLLGAMDRAEQLFPDSRPTKVSSHIAKAIRLTMDRVRGGTVN